MPDPAVVIVGGTSGIGLRLAESYAARGRGVVIAGRDIDRARAAAAAIPGPGQVDGCAVDLASPDSIADCLADLGRVARLVVGAVDRDANTVVDYDVARALRLVTLKLVGYTEVVHTLLPRLAPD